MEKHVRRTYVQFFIFCPVVKSIFAPMDVIYPFDERRDAAHVVVMHVRHEDADVLWRQPRDEPLRSWEVPRVQIYEHERPRFRVEIRVVRVVGKGVPRTEEPDCLLLSAVHSMSLPPPHIGRQDSC